MQPASIEHEDAQNSKINLVLHVFASMPASYILLLCFFHQKKHYGVGVPYEVHRAIIEKFDFINESATTIVLS